MLRKKIIIAACILLCALPIYACTNNKNKEKSNDNGISVEESEKSDTGEETDGKNPEVEKVPGDAN